MKEIVKQARIARFDYLEHFDEIEIAESYLALVVELEGYVFDIERYKFYPLLSSDYLNLDLLDNEFYAYDIRPILIDCSNKIDIIRLKSIKRKILENMYLINKLSKIMKDKKIIILRKNPSL